MTGVLFAEVSTGGGGSKLGESRVTGGTEEGDEESVMRTESTVGMGDNRGMSMARSSREGGTVPGTGAV